MNYSFITEISFSAGIVFALITLLLFFSLKVPDLIKEFTSQARKLEAGAYRKGQFRRNAQGQKLARKTKDAQLKSDNGTLLNKYDERTSRMMGGETENLEFDDDESKTLRMRGVDEATNLTQKSYEEAPRWPNDGSAYFKILKKEIVVND